MPRLTVTTVIAAPVQRCFDLARDIDLHLESLAHSGERAVAGRTSGLIGLGEEVTWRGRHFGVVQDFTSRITAFDPPRHFRDEMVRGAFRSFVHDHRFAEAGGVTRMTDVVEFQAPWGRLGRLAEALFLSRYVRRLLVQRASAIQRTAEGDRTS